MRRVLAMAGALTLCGGLAGCGDRGALPAPENPRFAELEQRVAALEKAVSHLQEQSKQAAKPSPEERLVGNWTPKQAGSPAWLLGLRLEPDRTCRFTLPQPDGGSGEALQGSYAVVGRHLVIDVPEPTGKRTYQWELRSINERSMILRRTGADGDVQEVRLQRQ